MNKDSLGDRMKRYEAASNYTLTPNTWVAIRVDGRAFHTYTRGLQKPFDVDVIEVMAKAARETARQIQGFRLAYVQSDEATFILTDTATNESEPWFGNRLNKLVSMSASLFTAYFNREAEKRPRLSGKLATFDSRAFIVPEQDVPNLIVWRQRDWERNSIQMVAQSLFSQKQLHGKKTSDLHEMLYTKGVNWAQLADIYKNGTFVLRNDELLHERVSYDDIWDLLNPVTIHDDGELEI